MEGCAEVATSDSHRPTMPVATTSTGDAAVSPAVSERIPVAQRSSLDSFGSAKSASSYFLYGTRGGGKIGNARPKSDVEWSMLRAKEIPGPGEYKQDSPTLCRISGGRFNLSKPKSDVEWAMLKAREIPGPGEYSLPITQIRGGKFSVAKPKTDIDLLQRKAREEPGPGQYEGVDRNHKISGGRFSTACPKSDVEVAMKFAREIPGPGQYRPDAAYKLPGGRFNLSNPKSDVEWSIIRAQQVPGPSQYDPDSNYKIAGGKFSNARPKSAIEYVQYEARQRPGPGEYNQDIMSIGSRAGCISLQASRPSLPPKDQVKIPNMIPPEARRKPRPKSSISEASTPSSPTTSRDSIGGRKQSMTRAASAPPRSAHSDNTLDSRSSTRVSTPENGSRKPRAIHAINVDLSKTAPMISSTPQPDCKTQAATLRERLKSAESERPRKTIVSNPVENLPRRPKSTTHRSSTPPDSLRVETRSRTPTLNPMKNPNLPPSSARASQTRNDSDQQQRQPAPKNPALRQSSVPYKIPSDTGKDLSRQISNESMATLFSAEEAKHMRRSLGPLARSQRSQEFPYAVDVAPSRASARLPRDRRKKKLRKPESIPSEQPHLSHNALKLLELAMQNPEFRRMMGHLDEAPNSPIKAHKFASMWSFQPLFQN